MHCTKHSGTRSTRSALQRWLRCFCWRNALAAFAAQRLGQSERIQPEGCNAMVVVVVVFCVYSFIYMDVKRALLFLRATPCTPAPPVTPGRVEEWQRYCWHVRPDVQGPVPGAGNARVPMGPSGFCKKNKIVFEKIYIFFYSYVLEYVGSFCFLYMARYLVPLFFLNLHM